MKDSFQNIVHLIKNDLLLEKPIKIFMAIGLEGFIWIVSLVYFAFFVNPSQNHFTFCPLANAGFEHCPGCGLGSSIAYLFHGNLIESFSTHILAIPAVMIISHRIFTIINSNLKKVRNTNN
jgi:hypothetical protein